MNGLLQLTDAAAAGSGAVMGGTPNVDYSVMLAAAQAKDAEKAPAPTEAPVETPAEPTEAPAATVAPTEAPADDTTVDAPAKNGKGGLVAVAVVAVLAVAGVAGAVVLKKKKATK